MTDQRDKADALKWRRKAERARNFPTNTDPCSRHVRLMANALSMYSKRYPMFDEEPEHCAISLYVTVAQLWELRTLVMRAVDTADIDEAIAVLRKVARR